MLLDEVLQWLEPGAGKTVVDGTLGGGGHTAALAAAVRPGGKVIALDLDPEAIERCQQIIAEHSVEAFCANYCDLGEVASEGVDAILLDLGLSSDQLADAERGFSFSVAGRLDLRFDRTQGESASELLARIDERSLADLIYRYGEERFSRRIAKKIVATRREHPLHRAEQLADLVRSCVPRSRGHRIDPATRTFQALRIAVNGELESLESALKRLPECLLPGGRLAIISFHSLEDRLVKHAFREDERLNVLTKKPLQATENEIAKNPRSRSAKLRVAERR